MLEGNLFSMYQHSLLRSVDDGSCQAFLKRIHVTAIPVCKLSLLINVYNFKDTGNATASSDSQKIQIRKIACNITDEAYHTCGHRNNRGTPPGLSNLWVPGAIPLNGTTLIMYVFVGLTPLKIQTQNMHQQSFWHVGPSKYQKPSGTASSFSK